MLRSTDHRKIAASETRPTASAKIGSEVSIRQPLQVSATSPLWSPTQVATSAAAAINIRNRMIRIIGGLWRWFAERRRGIGRELTGGRRRSIARIGLLDPWLQWRTIGCREAIQFAPRRADIVEPRGRSSAAEDRRPPLTGLRGDAADANQPFGAGLQTIDYAGSLRDRGFARRQPTNQRQQLFAECVGARHARRGEVIERRQQFRLCRQGLRRRQRGAIGFA